MSEKEKMINGEYYFANDPELLNLRIKAQELCWEYNNLPPSNKEKREELLSQLINAKGKFCIEAPFKCDYGFNITVGDNFYSNYNCVILDCGKITIGDNVMFGPNVSLYGATHPLDAYKRCDIGGEYGGNITIGNKVWIGGGSTILPGVTIGDEVVVGAGSVVTKDVPPKVVVAGNPARIIKNLS